MIVRIEKITQVRYGYYERKYNLIRLELLNFNVNEIN